MSLVAFKPDMQYTFLFTNFVWSSYGSPWLQLSAQGKLGALSQQACSAFSYVTFGRHHVQPNIELDGITKYGLAVSKVRAGLGDPTNPAFAELLAPILIFLLYSSSVPSIAESHSHVMGLFTLLHMASPKAFQHQPLRDVFSSCRATLITVGLLRKQRLFLEDQRWQTVPWALQSGSKSNQDQLVDVLVKVPGFLQDQQTCRSTGNVAAKQKLIEDVLKQLRLLFQWRWKWEAYRLGVAREEDRFGASFSTIVPLPKEVERLLTFMSFGDGVEIALYDAVLLCLQGLLYSELDGNIALQEIQRVALETRVHHRVSSDSGLVQPDVSKISLRATAIEIVRTFEYELLHIHQSEGVPTLFWLFPLGLAGKILQDDAHMTRWIQALLDTSEVTRGYGRGDNAFGFGFYELPKVVELSEEGRLT